MVGRGYFLQRPYTGGPLCPSDFVLRWLALVVFIVVLVAGVIFIAKELS